MGVISEGQYGIPRGINFSFPVECQNGEWKVVEGLNLSDFSKKMINTTTKELMEEKAMAL